MTPDYASPHPVVSNQRRVVLALLHALRPHLRGDRSLPTRIESLIKADRRFGSRDRRLYRELLYTAVRYLPWIEGRTDDEAIGLIGHLAAELPATHGFRAAFGAGPLPDGLDPDELLPAWLRAECPAAFEPAVRTALCARAPLWLRLQVDDPAPVAAEFASLGWTYTPSPLRPDAWAVDGDRDLTRTDAFAHGLIEVQDLGSQLILDTLALEPGGHWLDACAGAGGKTLQLARLLGPAGRVTAHDVRPGALAELEVRAHRAGLRSIVISRTAPTGLFDGVLVDAPCSGTGTWRRSPHLKWNTTPEHVARSARLQSELLRRFSERVRPGGRLVYATCSLCRSENEAIVTAFLADRLEFTLEPPAQTFGFPPGPHGLAILPGRHDTDGFFVASMRRA